MAGFPTLTELLDVLAFLGEEPAALGALATALLLVVLRDWRWSLLALAVQYVLAGWLLTGVFEPEIAPAIAAIKVVAGLIICLTLHITARQVQWGQKEPKAGDHHLLQVGRWMVPTSLLFRLLIGLLAAAAILYTADRGSLALPELPPHINLAALSLLVMGLLAMGLTDEPLTAGMGLLTLMTGFELFYHSLEQAITVISFLVGVDFLIAIITAYLTIARHLTLGEAERRGQT